MRDDAVVAERLEESNERKGGIAPGSDVVMGHSSRGRAAKCTRLEEHE